MGSVTAPAAVEAAVAMEAKQQQECTQLAAGQGSTSRDGSPHA